MDISQKINAKYPNTYRTHKSQKLNGSNEDASGPLGREKKATTKGTGRDLGRKRDGEALKMEHDHVLVAEKA